MATGENTGTWGNVTNVNLGTALEEAITGSVDVTFASADVTLTLTNTNATQSARNLRLNCTGTTGGSARNLILGSGCQIEKVYIVNNGCGDTITIKNTTGNGIAVPAGKTMYVFNTGTNVVDAITHLTSLTLASPLPVASGGTGSATASFSGANISNLNGSNVTTGTIDNARTTAASANGASTIVARDASGNFSANTVTANLTGTASNATVLQTARTIALQDGVTGTATSFNGSANISIPVTAINASVINTGTIANARTTASSSNGASTIVSRGASGEFAAGTITATFSGDGSAVTGLNASNISSGTLANARTTASSSNGASTIVARDASGNFSANTITASLNGNASTATSATSASTATTLATGRNFEISGGATAAAVSFNGSGNVNLSVTGLNVSTANSGTLLVARGGTGVGTITGLVKGNGTSAFSAAVAGTDYSAAIFTISNKTSAYTIIATDNNSIINCTSGTFTVSLTAAATLGAGFNCWIWNISTTATDVITIDPNGSETIDGIATLTLRRGEGMQIVCDGTNWQTNAKKVMRGYAENMTASLTRPVASAVGAIAIGYNAVASQSYGLALGISSTASGNSGIAGPYATASGANSVAFGADSTFQLGAVAAGDGSVALGRSYAGGTNSFAAAINNNTSSYGATGTSSIALGNLAKASINDAIAFGNLASASGNGSVAIGNQVSATNIGSFAMGAYALSDVQSKAAYSGVRFNSTGDAQTGKLVLVGSTTDATPKVLTSNNGTATFNTQLRVNNDTTIVFSILLVARRTDVNNESAGYKFEGVIDNNAGTTALVGTVTKTVLAEDTAAWDANVTADNSNGCLAITVTGEAGKTIYWVATCWTSEVTG
jgi:hypothetical protein